MHKPFVFFGTPYVARDTLAYLVSKGFVPKVVISSPDAPRGRGLVLTPSETKTWALEHNLQVYTPETLDADARKEVSKYGAEYAVVVAYGKILSKALIDAFPLGVLNIHYSLLPKYRGASPVEAALLNGDTVTGVAIQKMAVKLDAGDILAVRKMPIAPDDTTRELRPKLIEAGAELLCEMLPAFETGTLTPVPQDESSATYAGKIAKEDGRLLFADEPVELWNRYRAYAESPGTYFYMEKDGKQLRVKIRTATYRNGTFVPLRVVPEGKNETAYDELLKNGWRAL